MNNSVPSTEALAAAIAFAANSVTVTEPESEAEAVTVTSTWKPTRGRKPLDAPRDSWSVKVDLDVAIWWRARLYDEIEGRVRKGSMSDLTSRLLREEMNRLLAGGAPR